MNAATWVTRRRSGLNADGEAELKAWLGADPRHAEAFADMDATFGDVQQLPDDDIAALKAERSHTPKVNRVAPPQTLKPLGRAPGPHPRQPVQPAPAGTVGC